MTFEKWMQAVDQGVDAIAGLSAHDLADAPFRDLYDSGESPNEAAEYVLLDNGYPVELF